MKDYINYLDTLSNKQLMLLLARQRQKENEGISVIGMGCRFPGGIDNSQDFWTLLSEANIVPVTHNESPCFSNGQPRWNLAAEDLKALNNLLHPGSYLDNIDLFDAEYFGYQADEIDCMDPQQRLLLEVTVQALADANIPRSILQKKSVGIFVGMSGVEYPIVSLRNGLNFEKLSHHLLNGSTLSAASGRLGLMLGVNGPAMTIDTASSSALTAVHLAIQSLRNHECDIAIIGATQLLLSPVTSVILAKAGLTSTTGNSLPFTNDADGFVRSEGCGVVILKRSQDAKDDLSYAMIRGSAVHQHGDRLALSVASSLGQEAVISQALKNANLKTQDVQYVEMQSNGLRVGGAVETEAVAKAYERESPSSLPLYIGSCKANLGYLEIASGVASLLKVTLSLSNNELTPQIGTDNLDSNIPWKNMSLKLATQLMPWPKSKRKIAGISAFGVNGINAHILIEGVNDVQKTNSIDKKNFENEDMLLVLSAHSINSLSATAARLHQYLSSKNNWHYECVCRTLIEGRDMQKNRRALVVSSRDEVLDALLNWSKLQAIEENENTKSFTVDIAAIPPVAVKIADFDETVLRRCLALGMRQNMGLFKNKIEAYLDAMSEPPLSRILDSTETLPESVMLAFLLSWLDMLSSLGLQISHAEIQGKFKNLLFNAITKIKSHEELVEQWRNELSITIDVNTGRHWAIDNNESTLKITRHECNSNYKFVSFDDLDCANWFGLVAEHYMAGDELILSELTKDQDIKMLRLPGPVLIGKRFWPKQFQWH